MIVFENFLKENGINPIEFKEACDDFEELRKINPESWINTSFDCEESKFDFDTMSKVYLKWYDLIKNTDEEIKFGFTKTIILISGYKRSGKDTTANIFKEYLDAEIVSFAKPVKDLMCLTFGITHEQLDKFKNNKETLYIDEDSIFTPFIDFREILENFATDAMRESGYFKESIWIDLAKDKINNSEKDYILIPDFRFPNEFDELSEYNIKTVRVNNSNIIRSDSKAESSLEDFKFDFYIDNSKMDIEDLKRQVKDIIDML